MSSFLPFSVLNVFGKNPSQDKRNISCVVRCFSHLPRAVKMQHVTNSRFTVIKYNHIMTSNILFRYLITGSLNYKLLTFIYLHTTAKTKVLNICPKASASGLCSMYYTYQTLPPVRRTFVFLGSRCTQPLTPRNAHALR